MSDETTGGPTLGEIYWTTLAPERPDDSPAYADLPADVRAAIEAGAAAAGALAISRLQQPAELAAAMTESVKIRKVVRKLLGVFSKPDDRRMCHADVTAKTLDRYAAEAGVRL